MAALSNPALIQARHVPAQPWRNGGGTTQELLRWPAGTQDWQLRISLAQIHQDGPFSEYPGIQRWFTVIAGAGVRLQFACREACREHRLEPGTAPLRFDGALPARCALIDGPTTDLNLMHAGGSAVMQLAQPGTSWVSALPQRGMFTRTAGQCRAGRAGLIAVPAHCLLWLVQADAAAWTFHADEADSPQAAVPAIWLGFEPAGAAPGAAAADS
jgi:environmental stress-induced protein Ves